MTGEVRRADDLPRSGDGPRAGELDHVVARLLMIGTYLSVALLAAGVAVLLGTGGSPLDPSSDLDLGRIVSDLAALRPDAFLWLGLIAMIATPSARVAVSLVGYLRRGEREMAVVSVGILAVIVLGVVLATGSEG